MRRTAGLLLALVVPAILEAAQLVAFDYSQIYEASKPAVVTVETDDGSGSGFLISPFGHIATNYHVVRKTRYLAVEFPDGRRVKAVVAAVNPQYDMAVLKVNSSITTDIHPLPILPEEKEGAIKVGMPVVAIGSPLNQKFLMTQGILSKVDDNTVLGDFLLQAGNSGGPLLNSNGEVIGINTFGEANISGAIRIGMLRTFLQSPELIAESVQTEPPSELLRSVRMRYPVNVLNMKIEHEPLDWGAYRFKAGDFTVTAITPVLIGKVEVIQEKARATNRYDRRSKNISDPAYNGFEDPYYEWHRSTETGLDFAVTFDIRPESGLTKRSMASRILAPILMFGKRGPLEKEFKAEFMDFRIYRDGELIEPIMPGRTVVSGDSDAKRRFVDQAYAGSYVYAPEDFLTGNEFRFQVVDARKPDEVHKEVIFTPDSKLIRQLRSDFDFGPSILISTAQQH